MLRFVCDRIVLSGVITSLLTSEVPRFYTGFRGCGCGCGASNDGKISTGKDQTLDNSDETDDDYEE